MDSASIRLVYEKLSTDSVQLQNGKEFLENLLTTNPNFLKDSLLLCLDPSLGITMRQFIGVLVKNLLKDNWETHASLNHAHKQVKLPIFLILMFFLEHSRNNTKGSCGESQRT